MLRDFTSKWLKENMFIDDKKEEVGGKIVNSLCEKQKDKGTQSSSVSKEMKDVV